MILYIHSIVTVIKTEENMARRECVIQIQQNMETNPIPYHMDFTEQTLEKRITYTENSCTESKVGTYLYYKQYGGVSTKLLDKSGYHKADFSVVWNRNGADKDIGILDENIIEDQVEVFQHQDKYFCWDRGEG